ncbi:MAG: D-glucuronyl C5-epimerase family protein [Acutalibacteraceae bacterium]|jgi:hypothetical protein
MKDKLAALAALIRRWIRQYPRRAVAVAAAAAVLALTVGVLISRPADPAADPDDPGAPIVDEDAVTHAAGTLDAKLYALRQAAQKDGLAKAPFVVFFSATDGKERAGVVHAVGDSADGAWQAAEQALRDWVSERAIKPIWLRADVVYKTAAVTAGELEERIKASPAGGFRQGIAFDGNFSTALLEGELNGAGIVDHQNDRLDLAAANVYLAGAGRPGLSVVPDKLTLFSTAGYICGEDDVAVALERDGVFTGQRMVTDPDQKAIGAAVSSATRYLSGVVRDDGRFLYSYQASTDRRSTGYNMVRHCGTLWSLCEQENTALRLPIDRAIAYLQTQLVNRTGEAYVRQSEDEVSLGGNALAVVALCAYADRYGTEETESLIRELANGVLRMQREDGGFDHMLSAADLSVTQPVRSAYFDGEAAFALARAYAVTGDERYLEAAKKAADWMIGAGYGRNGDHWVAYAVNELTKYEPLERYFQLGIDNLNAHILPLTNKQTPSPTGLELLAASFEMLTRMQDQHLFPRLVDGVDMPELAKLIGLRIERLMSGYFRPETAMYMARPDRINGTFYVRSDRFRVRIDDQQHAIGGLTVMLRHYDAWRAALGD